MFKLTALMLVLITVQAFARPLPLNKEKLVATNTLSTAFDFSGQVSLGDCSGSVVKLSDRQDPNSKALVLTNGHCLGQIDDDADAVYVNQSYSANWKAFTNQSQGISVKAAKIVYAIMQPHDIALVEIKSSYAELEAQGVKSRVLATSQAPIGERIVLASGLFRSVEECRVDAIIYRIKEDKWINHNSYKYRDCHARHGTSGSPLVSVVSGLVVGVNYTGNDNGGKCTFNNPCEIDENGTITVEKGANYGDQTCKLATCLNDEFEFDLNASTCTLPKAKP